jgi:signal transduction histidine kinase
MAIACIVVAAVGYFLFRDLDHLQRLPKSDISWVGTQLETSLQRFRADLAMASSGSDAELQKSWDALGGLIPAIDQQTMIQQIVDQQGAAMELNHVRNDLAELKAMAAASPDLLIQRQNILSFLNRHEMHFRVLAVKMQQVASTLDMQQRARTKADVYAIGLALGILITIMAIIIMAVQTFRLKKASAALAASQARADHANRAKSEFLAHMSHELRTPLNAVIGFSELMATQAFGPIGDARYLGYCGDITAAGKYLLGLINNILDLSRIEHNQLGSHPQDFSLDAIARECLEMFIITAEKKGITLTFAAAPAGCRVRADPGHVRQILLNLLANAIKFTPRGGSVEFGHATMPTGDVEVWVKDTGIGIAAADLPKVMQPFGRMNRAELAQEGSGLGLSICRSLADMNEIQFDLRSEPGKGTCAHLVLPAAAVTGTVQAKVNA